VVDGGGAEDEGDVDAAGGEAPAVPGADAAGGGGGLEGPEAAGCAEVPFPFSWPRAHPGVDPPGEAVVVVAPEAVGAGAELLAAHPDSPSVLGVLGAEPGEEAAEVVPASQVDEAAGDTGPGAAPPPAGGADAGGWPGGFPCPSDTTPRDGAVAAAAGSVGGAAAPPAGHAAAPEEQHDPAA
jgi:hypothetical protein